MAQDNPGDSQGDTNSGGSSRRSAPASAPSVELLDVVEFTHPDVLGGPDIHAVGVVVRSPGQDDQTVTVRPLAHFSHDVALDNVTKLSAADLADD